MERRKLKGRSIVVLNFYPSTGLAGFMVLPANFLKAIDGRMPLLVKIAVPLILVSFLTTYCSAVQATTTSRKELTKADEGRALLVSSFVEAEIVSLGHDPVALSRSLSEVTKAQPYVRAINVYRTDGSAAYRWAGSGQISTVEGLAEAQQDILSAASNSISQHETIYDGETVLETLHLIRFDDGASGAIGLYTSKRQRDSAITVAARQTVFTAAMAEGLEIIALASIFYFLVLRRLRRLSKAAAQVGKGDFTVRLKDGSGRPNCDELTIVSREFENMIRSVESLHEEIKRQAISDPLTGLFNLRHLQSHLEVAVAESLTSGTSLAVIVADLDGFKQINDRLGHSAGDLVLKEVASAMTNATRSLGTCWRLGGDEFAVGLPGIGERKAAVYAEALRQAVGSLTVAAQDGTEIRVSISVGIAILGRDGETTEALLRAADRRMYGMKAAFSIERRHENRLKAV